jgi:hypothetical protein
MDRALRDEYHISHFDMMRFLSYRDRRLAAQDVLLVFHGVRVARHAAPLLHGKLPQGKIGPFLGGDQDLDGRILSGGDVLRFDILRMFNRHKKLSFLQRSAVEQGRCSSAPYRNHSCQESLSYKEIASRTVLTYAVRKGS